jgi:very-short-patch-repair endonuclease
MKYTKNCTVCNQQYETRNLRSVACYVEHLSEWRHRTYKGRKFTPEHVAKLNVAKLRENVVKHGDYVCDVCGKQFDTNTGLRSHRSYCSSTDEPRDVACHECGEVFKRQRGLTWHMKFHEFGYLEEHIRLTKEGLCAAPVQKRNSDEELRFLEKLRTFYPDVVHRHRIDGINHEFDFFVPSKNLIVEYDGDYWHGNPAKHELTPAMKKQFRLDQSWTRAVRALGYEVHRVWASEAVNYPDKLRTMD